MGELKNDVNKNKKRVKMNFDDMLEELGEMGKFQLTTYLLVCIPVLFGGANSLSYVFTAGIPNYRCFIPECDNLTNAMFNTPWVPMAIPPKSYGLVGSDYTPDPCKRYRPEHLSNLTNMCTAEVFTEDIVSCDKWVFDGQERTIVNDWSIMCLENQWKLSLVGMMHFAGVVVGSAFFGFLADKYGRKLIFIVCIMLMAISGALQVISPEYNTFTFLVFINSVGTAGVYPLAFIIGVELVGRKKREMTGMVLNYFYALGEALLALIAYMSRDWRWTQLIVSAPCMGFFIYYWCVPESVRWLLVNQKSKKAKYIVCKAAKTNGVVLSENLLATFEDDEEKELQEESNDKGILLNIKLLMKTRKMVVRFTIVLFLWSVNAFVYYGLSLNSTSMIGNKYINFALMCLIEIPGYTIGWISIKYLGRKTSLIGSFVLCGITCATAAFMPQDVDWAILTLSLIGKLGITSAFGVIYVYTAELLPTQIRSAGVGTASTTGRFGALIAPYVPILGVYIQPLPMLLFGGISIVAAVLGLVLPETKGVKLPETWEEAEKL